MRNIRTRTKVIVIALGCAGVTALLLWLGPIVFPSVGDPSETYDCDDATLAMYEHFQSYGIETRVIIGDLQAEQEDYLSCNHVWLLVNICGHQIAYDWGVPQFDAQHYEGYEISLDRLLAAVAEDAGDGDYVASAR